MDHADRLAFTAVPLRSRRDGWTPLRQRAFIGHIAAGMPSNHAARLVGMSKQTAHALRRRPGAESFAAAWDRAVSLAKKARRRHAPNRTDAALDGVAVPVRYRGRVVGTEIQYDDRQLVRLLGQALAQGLMVL